MTTTPNPCACRIVYGDGWGLTTPGKNDRFVYCPLHAAAQQMLDALTSLMECQNHGNGACYQAVEWGRAAINAAREGVTTG